MDRNSYITELKGIGPKTKESFAKMGVYTVGDILLHFPRTYVRFPKAVPIDELESLTEEHYAIIARVGETPVVKNTRKMQITLLNIGMTGHRIQLVWFRMPYIKSTLVRGHYFVFYGRIVVKEGRYVMEQPVIYKPEAYQTIEESFMPVYPLSAGVTNNLMTKTLRQLTGKKDLFPDELPDEIRLKYGLCEYNYAISQIHFPDDMEVLIDARARLVFDEFFYFIMSLQYQKEKKGCIANEFSFSDESFIWELTEKLPYELTGAQKRALLDVAGDMKGEYVMQRLIQGDVGSGKTIIAFLAMAWCAKSGYQSAIMAPTEVLARQHFESYQKLCGDFELDFPVVLLTGSMTAKQKREAYSTLKEQKNALVIGTHALIQEKAVYDNLSLVITDEQHRFGVKQREEFAEKGRHPHVLVMSATPIPRTLAIIFYGDLDISVVDEVPARRLPIKNCVVPTGYRATAYKFIADQVKLGHQAYVICPLVEASENSDGENVGDYAERLVSELPDGIKVGVLHGKMKNDKKNKVMDDFAANKLQVLVSTTVVEVGVNVPNSTVMMIEDAQRFGLAQLHQLRGRVGRGDAQSYCIMVNTSPKPENQRRLDILNHSNDGFKIASEDLKLRGPGDFFGIRQSGDFAFELADIYQDAALMQKASEAVSQILEADPALERPEHARLRSRINIIRSM